jgi:hypothetical protein
MVALKIRRVGFAYGIAATAASLVLQLVAWAGHPVLPPGIFGAGFLAFHISQLYFLSEHMLPNAQPVLRVTKKRVRTARRILLASVLLVAGHICAVAIVSRQGSDLRHVANWALGSAYLCSSILLMLGWGLTYRHLLPWHRDEAIRFQRRSQSGG